jgi:threonine dehydrogenase-like Zn-dependent dehydrogenase
MHEIGFPAEQIRQLIPQAGGTAAIGEQGNVCGFVNDRKVVVAMQNTDRLYGIASYPRAGNTIASQAREKQELDMRAAIMRNRQMIADEIAAPVPGPGEVLVKTLACGICGSDLHAFEHFDQFTAQDGGFASTLDAGKDLVMGHEFCAEIVDFGPGDAPPGRLAVGTRVCSMPTLIRNAAGVAVGYSNDVPGGYAEQMLLNEMLLLPVPNGLPDDHAALTEPMAVGLHAVEKASLTADDVPLVIGCGPVGLAVIAALRLKGARPIIAADFSPARRALAEVMGADIVIDPAERSPYDSWRQAARASEQGARAPVNPLSGERMLPPGVYFECVGVPGVIDQMMVGAERGCRFVVVGVCMESDPIRPLLAIGKELSLQFVLAYTPEEFAVTLHHIAEGEIPVAPLITGHVDVAGVAQAFKDLRNPEAHAKIVVEPWR